MANPNEALQPLDNEHHSTPGKGKELSKQNIVVNEVASGSGRGKNARMRVFNPVYVIPLAMRPKSAIFMKIAPFSGQKHWCKDGAKNYTCWEMWVTYDPKPCADGNNAIDEVASQFILGKQHFIDGDVIDPDEDEKIKEEPEEESKP